MDSEKVSVKFRGKYATAFQMPGFHGVICPDEVISMDKAIYEAEYIDKGSIFELVAKESKKKTEKTEKIQEDEQK